MSWVGTFHRLERLRCYKLTGIGDKTDIVYLRVDVSGETGDKIILLHGKDGSYIGTHIVTRSSNLCLYRINEWEVEEILHKDFETAWLKEAL